MFAYELQRRLTAADAQTISVAAHPGAVRIGLQRHLPGPVKVIANAMMILRGQRDARMGALATLRAATDLEPLRSVVLPAARGPVASMPWLPCCDLVSRPTATSAPLTPCYQDIAS
jgi:hypothetical protein